MSGGTGNDDDGPKVSRAHVEPHPGTTPERTVTWPVKDGDALIGTVRLSKGVHECVLPDGTVVERASTSRSSSCTNAGDRSLQRNRHRGLKLTSTS